MVWREGPERRQRQIGMRTDLQIRGEERGRARAAFGAAAARLAQVDGSFRREALDAFNEADANARLRREELRIALQKNALTTLLAPDAGVVQQLQVNTIGGVVKPADPLMVTVPAGAELVVEAMVLNRDAGFVHEGQPVEVKLEAYPFTRYGVVPGRLEHISRDAIKDETRGLVYTARVKLSRSAIMIDGNMVNLLLARRTGGNPDGTTASDRVSALTAVETGKRGGEGAMKQMRHSLLPLCAVLLTFSACIAGNDTKQPRGLQDLSREQKVRLAASRMGELRPDPICTEYPRLAEVLAGTAKQTASASVYAVYGSQVGERVASSADPAGTNVSFSVFCRGEDGKCYWTWSDVDLKTGKVSRGRTQISSKAAPDDCRGG